jgi:hypothetical protein
MHGAVPDATAAAKVLAKVLAALLNKLRRLMACGRSRP